jgi:hypothetical protein
MVSFEWLPLVDQDMKTCGAWAFRPGACLAIHVLCNLPLKEEGKHILFKLEFCIF